MYNPHERGRWYRLFIESDGTTALATNDDLGCIVTNSWLECPKDFHILEHKRDIHSVANGGLKTVNEVIRIYADGSQGLAMPDVEKYDYMYIYIFGYFD